MRPNREPPPESSRLLRRVPAGGEARLPVRPAPHRLPRDPGREVLEGLLGGVAVALLVCVAAFASTSWLAA